MRTKTFVLFLSCIVITSVFLIAFGSQRPSIQTIVSETHKQLNNLKNFKENLENAESMRLVADEKYLNLLGFTESPRLYPSEIWKNTSLPIVVTYVLGGQEQQGIGFIRNIAHFLPNHTILVYNLGLGSYGLQTILGHCNSSRCTVINFDYSAFPSHVEEERLCAFRPLIIQDALNKAGGVLFLENDQRLVTSRIEPLLQTALKGGAVLSWATHHATSSLTHPKMFDYFRTTAENFLFLRMVEMSKLLLYNTVEVHKELMLPWVQCALTQDCIHPIGAQSAGCRFNKKPQYRYTGCHRYDGSAFNIVLGLHFHFDESSYIYQGHDVFFRKATLDTEVSVADSNTTDTMSGA